jgi:hypothetical protein
MLMRTTTRLRFLRLAIFAVLLNALGPAIASSLAASRPAVPIDVCATHGGRALAVAAALLTQAEDDEGRHAAGCGHCLAHHGHCAMADGPGLPPASAAVPAGPSGAFDRPAALPERSHPLAHRPGAPPRGPPSFS